MSTYIPPLSSSGWRDASTAWKDIVEVAAEAVLGGQRGRGRDQLRRGSGQTEHDHDHHGHRHGRRRRDFEPDGPGRANRAEGGPGFPFGPGGFFGAGGPGGHPGHGGAGGAGGVGFGPGFGPPGPWRARGRGRGRGARRRGDVRAAILVLLDEAPRHGYELISEISDRSGGVWRPSPGTVYPTLSQLEDEGLIRVERLDGRKTATLTDEGRAHVAENREQLGTPWADVAGGVRAENLALRGVIAQVGIAAGTVALHGSPAQATRAAEILEQTRQELYGLMAEPKAAAQPPEEQPPDERATEDGATDPGPTNPT